MALKLASRISLHRRDLYFLRHPITNKMTPTLEDLTKLRCTDKEEGFSKYGLQPPSSLAQVSAYLSSFVELGSGIGKKESVAFGFTKDKDEKKASLFDT